MKKNIVFLLLCSCLLSAYAQKPPIKFGDVSIDQLKMTRYDKDSSAAAVVLADYGESTIDYHQGTGFSLNFERIRRIKILTKEGLDQANFGIELYHSNSGDDEKLSGLKAMTYNLENGKVVESKVGKDAMFKEKYDANRDLMKITWPNVKVGSILEITYKVNSDFFFNFQDWQFQEDIPIVWSEYRARIPEYFNYDKYMQGYIVLKVNEQTQVSQSIILNYVERGSTSFSAAASSKINNEKIDYAENRFRWVAQDVPAFKTEPFITTKRDYISKINFELSYTKFPNQAIKNYMGSWEDINKQYAESSDFGGEVNGNGFLKKTVEEIIAGITNAEEKMTVIWTYVKNRMVWDGTSRKYVSSSLKKAFEEKKGNSAEINLLLASMLEKAEIDVSPVLLSTRDHGFLRESIPVSSQFNYAICQARIGEKSFLLDATEKFLPVGVLPERCLNGKGLVVSKEGFKWADLQSAVKSKTIVSVDLVLTSSDELKGKLQIDRTGYYAINNRKKYFSKGESDYIKDFLNSRSWDIANTEFKNDKEITEPFIESYEVTIKDHVTAAGNMIYLNPFILNKEDENPFKLEKRVYPVDFGSPFDKMYLVKITIPEEYVIEELPKSKVFMLPNNAAKYFYNLTQVGNTINVTSSMLINNSLFTQDEYPNLREFYNQVVAKQAEQIVLKKK